MNSPVHTSLESFGIAATNVAFPLTTISVAIALLFGAGGASNLSLFLGKGDTDYCVIALVQEDEDRIVVIPDKLHLEQEATCE